MRGEREIEFIMGMVALALLACAVLPTPTATPEPTATVRPTVTPTPVVIVVTATPTATPTVDLYDLVYVPRELERFAAQLVPLHGYDFLPAPRLGITRDTIIYWGYESPVGSGQFHIARYAIVDDKWLLLDTIPMETPAPAPTPRGAPSPKREAMRWR